MAGQCQDKLSGREDKVHKEKRRKAGCNRWHALLRQKIDKWADKNCDERFVLAFWAYLLRLVVCFLLAGIPFVELCD